MHDNQYEIFYNFNYICQLFFHFLRGGSYYLGLYLEYPVYSAVLKSKDIIFKESVFS